MDRTEASIAPARGGDRTADMRTRIAHGRVPRKVPGRSLYAAATAILVAVIATTVAPGAMTGAAAAAAHRDGITLVSQSPWVGPGALHQDLTMGLRIRSSAPLSALRLSFTVYDAITSRSAFDETLSSRGLGAVDTQSPAIALSGFPVDAKGVTGVTIPVDGDATPTGTGNWTANLGCRPGSCANVYPVKVTLTDSSGDAGGAQLVTYLVYDDPSSSGQLLRFALVVPLGLSPSAAQRAGQAPTAVPAAVAGLEGLVGAVASAPAVPVTLAPDASTLEQLAGARRAHTVGVIAALSGSSSRQTLSGPYAPVDAAALVSTGLAGELKAQLRRGSQVLSSPGVAVHASPGTWVARSALTQGAIDDLAPDFAHMVVPPASVSGPMGPLTVTQPFTLASSTSTPARTSGAGAAPTATVSDAGIGARLAAGASTNASLAAVQLVAELSLIYYEVPNLRGPTGTPAPRGVVGVAPLAWEPSPTFVSTLLTDLQGNPVIAPVTLDQLFAQVPVGADGQPSARHTVTASAPASSAGPGRAAKSRQAAVAAAVRTARARQEGFASAVAVSPPGAALARTTGDLLLAAESSLLTPRQQQAGVAGFETTLGRELVGVKVRSDTIRLTAGTASVPITLVRNTPYPVTVLVRLTSDKLRFPRAATQAPGALCRTPKVQSTAGRSSFSALCTLERSTNAVYVNMQSRTSGDFEIAVTLKSPEGNLVLAGGQLTVRSLSTSAVAIALSSGAALVLLVWWGRTVWRGGKSRRGAHAVTRAKEATA